MILMIIIINIEYKHLYNYLFLNIHILYIVSKKMISHITQRDIYLFIRKKRTLLLIL